MFPKHRKSICKLTQILRGLEENVENYEMLLALQRALVDRLRRTEKRIATLKQQCVTLNQQKRGRLTKDAATLVKRHIDAVKEQIQFKQHLLFIWRCFGDGIAFIYLDKYALKHMLYNTHDYTVKQSAGALSDKDGFRLEWSILQAVARKQSVPAVLCDLTNTIRHGDVCVLVGPDPIPIEVKSSKNTNLRVERQLASLQALLDFLATDKAENFRGVPNVRRVEGPVLEEVHASVMNECIARSRATGFAAISPEEGLTYVCIRDAKRVEQLNQFAGSRLIYTSLNDAKTEGAWMPYYPFTLSIRDPEALYEFISGEITLIVLLDANIFVRRFAEHGLHAEFLDHDGYALMVSHLGSTSEGESRSALSKHMFGRLFHEFGSIGQLVDVEVAHLNQLEAQFAELAAKVANGELPADTNNVSTPVFKRLEWADP